MSYNFVIYTEVKIIIKQKKLKDVVSKKIYSYEIQLKHANFYKNIYEISQTYFQCFTIFILIK